uniref:Uncharacterized protein n=1 Tax=Moniliophthora roreri TaxID=221103 RepID=A0A0W0G243_MONRR
MTPTDFLPPPPPPQEHTQAWLSLHLLLLILGQGLG